MSDITAEKYWSISTDVAPGEPLRFFDGGSNEVELAGLSPVEQLLGAIGSCFGQSCAAMMQYYALPVSALRVVAHGHKPAGSLIGKGLDRLKLEVRFDASVDSAQRSKLLADTKKICTVTNSLSKDIVFDVALASIGDSG